MKGRLDSFAFKLPVIEIVCTVTMILVSALLSFIRLKQMAHGSGSASLGLGEFVLSVPSDSFLSVAFHRALWWAEGPITTLNVPAKFVETLVSLVFVQSWYWWPNPLPESSWHVFVYPIYGLPAWIYVGLGIDALIGRRRVHRWNAVISVSLAVTFGLLFGALRFGITTAEREGQERLSWFIDGFAIWAVLFSIPVVAWIRQKKQGMLVEEQPFPE